MHSIPCIPSRVLQIRPLYAYVQVLSSMLHVRAGHDTLIGMMLLAALPSLHSWRSCSLKVGSCSATRKLQSS